jgi:hypothetical protein
MALSLVLSVYEPDGMIIWQFVPLRSAVINHHQPHQLEWKYIYLISATQFLTMGDGALWERAICLAECRYLSSKTRCTYFYEGYSNPKTWIVKAVYQTG